ncbi:MAG: conjugal transfer ATP-binding protein TraC [Gammaproteobacteria bacterium]|jgi:conjugal transfer ATP-binding protein TraC
MSLSETDFEDLHGSWFQGFKSLPTGIIIHKQDIYQKEEYTSEKLPNTSFFRASNP